MKLKLHSTPKRQVDGYLIVREKIKESGERIGSVRFGVPFCEVTNQGVTTTPTVAPPTNVAGERRMSWSEETSHSTSHHHHTSSKQSTYLTDQNN